LEHSTPNPDVPESNIWDASRARPRAGLLAGLPWFQLVFILVALALTAGSAFVLGYSTANANKDSRLHILEEAWALADRDFYYTKPPENERLYGAIRGMLATFNDPHSLFLPPVQAAADARFMQGATGGVGANVSMNKDNQLVITNVRIGWPAEQAGVRSGDIVIAVDGKDIAGMALQDAVNLIRGPLDSQVKFTLRRPGVAEPLSLTMSRQQINVYGQMLADNIAYVSLSVFNETSPADLEKEIRRLLDQKPRALIFDLRGNGGGFLDQSVKIADLFLIEGPIASEKTSDGQVRKFSAHTGDIAEAVPLVVLVDGGSASASEIVAGALQDRKRGVLIGTRTYGKGSVQVLHSLSDGSQLRITHGAWYTPNETPIERRDQTPENAGLAPDVLVTVPDQPEPGTDPIRDAALDYIKKNF
jgi:carboxyl-terminal processing protease